MRHCALRFVPLIALCIGAAALSAPATSGKLQLVCASEWHKLDLTLAPGLLNLDREAWDVFNLPEGAKPGQTWKLDHQQVQPFIQALHNVAWKSDAKDEAAYKTWLGKGAALQTLGMQAGTLTISFVKDDGGQRLEFTGNFKAVDAGRYAARLGPTWFKEDWTHQLSGQVHLDENAVPTALEVTDQIDNTGLFFNQGKNNKKESETFTRQGTLQARVEAARAFTPAEEKSIRALIVQLGAEGFDEREAATKKLAELGPKIAPLLRGLGLTSKDAEIVRRSKEILARIEIKTP